NIIKHLLIGSAKARVISRDSFMIQEESVKKNFKIIHQSPEISSRAIIAHNRVPLEIKKAFVKSFVALSEREDLREALTKIQLPYPVPADYRDYKKLEKYDVEKYLHW
ncbi:MAG: PhnD/SsuA/transferrin family substrate-binding protein, partial [Candidatus Kryptonium sp.]